MSKSISNYSFQISSLLFCFVIIFQLFLCYPGGRSHIIASEYCILCLPSSTKLPSPSLSLLFPPKLIFTGTVNAFLHFFFFFHASVCWCISSANNFYIHFAIMKMIANNYQLQTIRIQIFFHPKQLWRISFFFNFNVVKCKLQNML